MNLEVLDMPSTSGGLLRGHHAKTPLKILALSRYLFENEALRDEDVLVAVDAFDVLTFGSEEEVLQKFED